MIPPDPWDIVPSDVPLRILRLARDAGAVYASDVAVDLGVDTSAAYRQLESLVARGLLDTGSVASGPGRPRKAYRVTPEGLETFRRDYALLLGALMDAIEDRRGRDDLLATLEHIGRGLGAPLANGPPEARLAAALRLYNDLGFEATVERDGAGAAALVQRNCPFLRSARADPQGLCECLDEGILRSALPGASVELRSSLARGDPRCRHDIRFP